MSDQAVDRPRSHVVVSCAAVRLSHGYRPKNNCEAAARKIPFSLVTAAEVIFVLVFLSHIIYPAVFRLHSFSILFLPTLEVHQIIHTPIRSCHWIHR